MYDIKKFQQELELPNHTLLQEVSSRWSILGMLESLIQNVLAVVVALQKANKINMMIAQTEIDQVKEIIVLLKPFKVAGEKLGKEKDVTITLIMPIFDHLKNKVLKHKPGDSNLIKSMKTSMKTKLENRYTEDQMELLTTIKKFDPRYKTRFNVCQGYLRRTITKFIDASDTDYIQATDGQEMPNLSNFNSARDRPGQATVLSPEEEMINSLFTDDDEDS